MSSPTTTRDDSGRPKPGLPLLESGDRLNSDEFLRRYERMPDVKKAELVEGVVYIASQLPMVYEANGHANGSAVPLLENGDTLNAEEFLRRYERMPGVKKAELVEGTVFMASPVSEFHSDPHFDLIIWLGNYRSGTPKVRGSDNPTVQFGKGVVFQPDAMLTTPAALGGKSSLNAKNYTVGSPELVAEVAMSSVGLDTGPKRKIYLKHGVAEYVLWRVEDEAMDWWTLRDGQYQAIEPDAADGLLKSVVYPGLWLDKPAMLRGDMPAVLAALQLGLASPGHAEFVAKLRESARI